MKCFEISNAKFDLYKLHQKRPFPKYVENRIVVWKLDIRFVYSSLGAFTGYIISPEKLRNRALKNWAYGEVEN